MDRTESVGCGNVEKIGTRLNKIGVGGITYHLTIKTQTNANLSKIKGG